MVMCELKINRVYMLKNLSDKNSRRCQLVVNSLSTKFYAGLRHFTRGKNNIIAALITRRSLVQIQLPQPRILGTSEVFGGAFFLP